jgi:hypothetical protein
MSCCGQHRQALASTTVRRTAPTPAHTVPSEPIPLGYRGDSPIVVRGAATGTTYLFGARGKTLLVDARDAPTLRASARFERF